MRGGRRIKLDIGNIKYKCNLPRFMFTVGERERERGKGTRGSGRDEVAARRSRDHTESRACSWLVGGPSFHFPLLLHFYSLSYPPFFLPFFSFGLGRKFPQVTSGEEKRLLPSILRILLFENVINRIK